MSRIRLLILCALFVLLPAIVSAEPVASQTGWLESMRLGGYVVVLRHGLTGSDASKDAMANPAKAADAMSAPAKAGPTAERQLSEQGRAQARTIGEAMRKLKIPVGLVVTSPLQRAVDTGTLLGFGDVVVVPDLAEAGAALPPEENKHRADALRRLVTVLPPPDNNLVIVTHKPNILEALGKDWSDVREGEASVFERDGKGGFRLIVRVQASEWAALLQAGH